jgi:hypothetical protein
MGVYLRVDEHWKPNENTLAYFPFTDDVLDHSGNNTLTNTQYLSKDTIGYKRVHSQWPSGVWIPSTFDNSNVNYINCWYKVNSVNTNGNCTILAMDKYWSGYSLGNGESRLKNKIYTWGDGQWTQLYSADWMSTWERHNFSIWFNGSEVQYSKDWVVATIGSAGYNFADTVYLCTIWNNGNVDVTFSNFICESQCWTQQRIQDYYNYTKSNYWIS